MAIDLAQESLGSSLEVVLDDCNQCRRAAASFDERTAGTAADRGPV